MACMEKEVRERPRRVRKAESLNVIFDKPPDYQYIGAVLREIWAREHGVEIVEK